MSAEALLLFCFVMEKEAVSYALNAAMAGSNPANTNLTKEKRSKNAGNVRDLPFLSKVF